MAFLKFPGVDNMTTENCSYIPCLLCLASAYLDETHGLFWCVMRRPWPSYICYHPRIRWEEVTIMFEGRHWFQSRYLRVSWSYQEIFWTDDLMPGTVRLGTEKPKIQTTAKSLFSVIPLCLYHCQSYSYLASGLTMQLFLIVLTLAATTLQSPVSLTSRDPFPDAGSFASWQCSDCVANSPCLSWPHDNIVSGTCFSLEQGQASLQVTAVAVPGGWQDTQYNFLTW